MIAQTRIKGFTLVELIVVVLILGTLAFITIPRVSQATSASKIKTCLTNVDTINRQIEMYKTNTGQWPQNYNKLSKDTDYFPDGPPECPFGTNYTINGTLHRVHPHTH